MSHLSAVVLSSCLYEVAGKLGRTASNAVEVGPHTAQELLGAETESTTKCAVQPGQDLEDWRLMERKLSQQLNLVAELSGHARAQHGSQHVDSADNQHQSNKHFYLTQLISSMTLVGSLLSNAWKPAGWLSRSDLQPIRD